MDPILIVVIVLLCAYPLVIATLIQMYNLALPKKETSVWKIVILALPVAGAVVFWAVRGKAVLTARKGKKEETGDDGTV